jgi:hypothetical protein
MVQDVLVYSNSGGIWKGLLAPRVWLYADAVVDRAANALLAPQVPLPSLDGNVAKEKLNLLKFSASTWRKRAAAAQIVRRNVGQSRLLR